MMQMLTRWNYQTGLMSTVIKKFNLLLEIDLVEMLKEYKKYRAFSENLKERVLLGRDTFKRPADLSLRSNTLWEVQKTDQNPKNIIFSHGTNF